MHAPGIFVLIGLGACLCLVSASAIAQAPPAGTRIPEPQPDLRPSPGIDIKPLTPPVSKPTVTGTVTVTRFRFTGSTVVSASELEPVVTPWTGRELSASDLIEAINAVTAYLRQRGLFVAHAYLPDQQITDGEVEIAILEGRIGNIKLDMPDDARLMRSVAEGFLSSLQPGSIIARGGFDSSLLLLNDLPGVRVSPALIPGKVPGTADLTAKVEDERMASGYLRLDNHEIRELGEHQLTAQIRFRNPLGIGDLATARLVGTHTGGRVYGTGTYSLPVNYLGTRLGFAFTHQKYRLGGDFEPLQANGDYTDVTLALLHPFFRSHDRNLSGSLSLNEIRYRDRIDAVAFAGESRHR